MLKSLIAAVCSCLVPSVLVGLEFSQPAADYESLLASAQQAQARGDFEAAAGFYQRASTLHPEIGELKANLGLMYYQSDRNEQAAEAFRQSIQIKPGLFVPNLFLGLDYVRLKHFGEAIPYLKRAARLKPDDIHVQAGLGQAYSGLGDNRLAIRAYLRATQIEPRDAENWYRLGVGYLEQVEADARILLTRHKDSAYLQALMADNFADRHAFIQAAESYQKALSLRNSPPGTHAGYALVLLYQHDFTGAERELKSGLASDPGSLLAKMGMARLEVEQGSTEQGAKQIAAIWKSDAGFLTSNARRFKTGLAQAKSTELLRFLEEFAVSGELSEQAVSLFRAAAGEGSASLSPRPEVASSNGSIMNGVDAATLYAKGAYGQCRDLLVARLPALAAKDLSLLALCAYSTGDYLRAFDAADKLSVFAVTEAEGLYWETKSSQKLATEALAHASEIDSNSPRLHVLLGDIYRQQKRLEEAEWEYRKALTLRPQDTGALFGLSLALLAGGQIDEALQVAQAAAKDNSTDPEINAVMGEILCEREDFSEAEIYLKKSLNTKPEYIPHVHALLGKVYANTNRTQDAIAELKLALPEDKDGHLYYQIGRLYLKTGDRDSAERAFQISKRLEREGLRRAAVDLEQGQDNGDFQ